MDFNFNKVIQKKDVVCETAIGNKLNIKRHKAVWQTLSWGFVSVFSGLLGFVVTDTMELLTFGIPSLSLLGVTIPGAALLFGPVALCAGMYTIGSLINVFAPGCKAARVFKSIGKALFGVGLAAAAAVLFFNPALLGVIGGLVFGLGETMALILEIGTFAVGVCTAISAVWPRMFKYIGHGIKCLFGNCSKPEEMVELSDKKSVAWKCEDASTCQKYLDSYDPNPRQGSEEPKKEEII